MSIAYTRHENRATEIPVEVHTATGPIDFTVDQKVLPRDGHGTFKRLGDFDGEARVVIHAHRANGFVIADAVWFRPIE